MTVRLPRVGDKVNIIEKRNYENGRLTTGVVKRLLSNPREVHPRGNKVEIEDGTVGRVVSFVDEVGPQNSVNPAERERYAAEIRVAGGRGRTRGLNFSRRGESGHRPFRSAETARRDEDLTNLPGEDDLR